MILDKVAKMDKGQSFPKILLWKLDILMPKKHTHKKTKNLISTKIKKLTQNGQKTWMYSQYCMTPKMLVNPHDGNSEEF